MKDFAGRAEQNGEYYSESPFDCFLKDALRALYQRRNELNRRIRYLGAAQRRSKSGNPMRVSRANPS